MVDEEEPPDSKHRDIDWRKLLAAAAVQGAIFRAVREVSDHYSRRRLRVRPARGPARSAPSRSDGIRAGAGTFGPRLARSADLRQS